MTNDSEKKNEYDRIIAKGALYNGLGTAGKALFPLFFIISARLHGTAVTGVYYLAFTILEITLALASSGFNNGIIMFSSRYTITIDDENILYQSLATGFIF